MRPLAYAPAGPPLGARHSRVVHVAALPFPTPQGTQAAVARMVEASARAGEAPTLVTYEDGMGHAPAGVRHVRVPRTKTGSLRSGPSLSKLIADAALAQALGALAGEADVFVAHHVEAALAALWAGVRPLVFVAHTALGPELPTYFAPLLASPLSRAGSALDAWLAARADAVAAVSPLLAQDLGRASGRVVHALPVPWPAPPPPSGPERVEARPTLGLAPSDEVVLYAGNLDAYQGLDVLGGALERLAARRERMRFLLATESPALEIVRHLGVRARPCVVRAPLATEIDRRLVHAAADVAVVPRRSPGGLPVKLLDAMARGVPTVAARRAAAGLRLEDAVFLAEDDDADALADALEAALGAPDAELDARVRRAREHVEQEHSGEAFRRALDGALAEASFRA